MASTIKVDNVQDQSGNNIINENANDITIGATGDTITIPSGATLVNNGTATGFGGIAWQSVVTGATLTAVAGNGYPINTTSNACTVTLPGSASVGDQIIFTDYLRTWQTNAVTLDQGSLKFQGQTTPNPAYDTDGESVHIVYMDATQGWIPINDGVVADEVPEQISADFLVIAGGGGGAGASGAGDSEGGGGGGAGGYRTSTQNLSLGSLYTITVGDGGAGHGTGNNLGNDGSDSSLSGSGVTTLTSTGGGGGGNSQTPGRNGGSGGGGGAGPSNPYAGGISSPVTSPVQGYAGGSGGNSSRAGGGGGAGAVGVDAATNAGNGGTGVASSITGASVTRAGGGGGGNYTSGNASSGGSGGGGIGGYEASGGRAGGDGTANLGSGGGGTSYGSNAGAGGKGVVILSVPDAKYSGTTTGSPTVATDAGGTGKTVMTFTGTGSYTA